MDSSVPVNAIHAFHSRERQLYARMVFDLGMHPTTAMEIVAFWLWLEENGHADIIRRISSLDDSMLLTVASVGRSFIETLHLDQTSNVPELSVDARPDSRFRLAAMSGISYYMNNVCYKAFDDILRRAQMQANLLSSVDQLIPAFARVALDPSSNVRHGSIGSFGGGSSSTNPSMEVSWRDNTGFQMPQTSNAQRYNPHGEGTSENRENISLHDRWAPPSSLNMAELGWPFTGFLEGVAPEHLPRNLHGSDRGQASGSTPPMMPEPCNNIPRDERTLFVTFSNGYPLTREELYNFFMSNYGDVDTITVQEPVDDKPPLYAHVSFHSLATLLRVLNGNDKVKFMTKGKHLWARRFVPKRKLRVSE